MKFITKIKTKFLLIKFGRAVFCLGGAAQTYENKVACTRAIWAEDNLGWFCVKILNL